MGSRHSSKSAKGDAWRRASQSFSMANFNSASGHMRNLSPRRKKQLAPGIQKKVRVSYLGKTIPTFSERNFALDEESSDSETESSEDWMDFFHRTTGSNASD